VLFEQADRVFVDRRAADADAGRRPEPIKDARLSAAAPARCVYERRGLVAPPIAGESKVRQNYFLFWLREFFRAAAAVRALRGFAPRAGAALRAGRDALASDRLRASPAPFRGSDFLPSATTGSRAGGRDSARLAAADDRSTSVNRVWSAIV
jgi:hypothetical protein